MPQMAPSNWLILFIMFNLIMILIISINYFIPTPSPYFKQLTPHHKNFYMQW